LKIDGYIRVSRVNGRGGENFISPKVQREKIRDYARLHGHKVVRWHEDLDQPGSRNGRPGFQAAIERVETGKTDGIAVAKLDRFARSVADAAGAIRRIRDAGGELVSVEDNFDSSTPMGKFAMHMLLALGELELDRIRENWSNAQRYAVERGVHIASKTPTGYKRTHDGLLEPDERAAAAVTKIYAARARGASYAELAQLLEEHGVRGPYRNRHWTTAAVAKLLRNPVYLGEARSGRHRKANAHKALVTRETWDAVQATTSPSRPRSSEGALLAGLLRCAGCRYLMKPDSMRDRDGERLRIYRCRGDHAAGRCPAPTSVLGRVIEPYVEEHFLAALEPGGVLVRGESSDDEREQIRAGAKAARRELEAYVENTPASIDPEAYRAGVEKRQQALDEALAAEAALPAEGASAWEEIGDKDIRALWATLEIAEKREWLADGYDAIIVRRGRNGIEDRVLPLTKGTAPDDLPRRGLRLPLASFPWPDEMPADAGEALGKSGKDAGLDRAPRRGRKRPRVAA
jgi:site-specific DNA recombinase